MRTLPAARSRLSRSRAWLLAERISCSVAAGAACLVLAGPVGCGPDREQGTAGPGAEQDAGAAGAPGGETGDRGVSEDGIRRLGEGFGLPRPVAVALLESIGASETPPADRDRLAEELALRYQALRAGLSSFRSSEAGVEDLKRDALAALTAGDFESSAAALEQAVVADLSTAEQTPEDAAERLQSAATSRGEIGEIALLQLSYSEAERHFKEAEQMLPEEAELARARHLGQLGAAQLLAGRHEEAQPNLEQSLHFRKRHLGNDHPEVVSCLSLLADLYRSRAEYRKAEILYQRAFKIRQGRDAPDSVESARLREKLIEVLRLQGKDAEAEALSSGGGEA